MRDPRTAQPNSRIGLASVATMTLLAVLTSACNGTAPVTPTTPTPVATPPQTTPPPITRRLTGVVRDDDDQPVPSAQVTVQGTVPSATAPAAPAITDANGFYEMSAAMDASFGSAPFAEVDIAKPGYEVSHSLVQFNASGDTTGNFHLFKPFTLTPGTDTHLRLTGDASVCGWDAEWVCRHGTGVAGPSGTLHVEILADNGPGQGCFGPVSYPFICITQMTVSAGTTTAIEILSPWSAPSNITLKSSIGP